MVSQDFLILTQMLRLSSSVPLKCLLAPISSQKPSFPSSGGLGAFLSGGPNLKMAPLVSNQTIEARYFCYFLCVFEDFGAPFGFGAP